ncbi:MAG TPA: hypothetical protein VFQ59_00040 [Candidatus Paceibacterota bacterium]|nr:hypothetical protein [Candidatus Paceibacterota bacterium]
MNSIISFLDFKELAEGDRIKDIHGQDWKVLVDVENYVDEDDEEIPQFLETVIFREKCIKIIFDSESNMIAACTEDKKTSDMILELFNK